MTPRLKTLPLWAAGACALATLLGPALAQSPETPARPSPVTTPGAELPATPLPPAAAAAEPSPAVPRAPEPAAAAPVAEGPILAAREAFRRKDSARLAELRAQTLADRHPLASWVDYWDTNLRLAELSQADLEAFYARWSGTYVEDRLRNDWLLELGRRRDFANIAREFPRFRMNDDREVTCFALEGDLRAGRDVREAAVAAWLAQPEADTGCHLLATALVESRRLDTATIWQKLRGTAVANKPRTARQAAMLLGPSLSPLVGEAFDGPARLLARLATQAPLGEGMADVAALAIARLAGADAAAAAQQLNPTWASLLGPERSAWAWAATGRQAAQSLNEDAASHYERAWAALPRGTSATAWGDDVLAWNVRAALRSARGEDRWSQVLRAVDAMSPGEQRDPAWTYWRARAVGALAPEGASGDAQRAASRASLEAMSTQMNFYGKLALEDLGRKVSLPPRPQALSPAEREAARQHAGLSRALALIGMGLRNEGVREWNFSLRGMDDRALLAAAQRACEREVWDRCINTSERTRAEVDITQRFPTPLRQDVVAAAQRIGLDPALVYGLIRQESRFIMDARSSVGASGLMQLMPETARLTARRIGLPYSPGMIDDRETNLRLGTSYLKSVLDDFNGSLTMAAAAYNAGPNRPRRWRNGPTLEPAIWAENIPFTETRDYVKKVLSNAVYYGAVLAGKPPSLRAWLGPDIGPRPATAPPPNRDLP